MLSSSSPSLKNACTKKILQKYYSACACINGPQNSNCTKSQRCSHDLLRRHDLVIKANFYSKVEHQALDNIFRRKLCTCIKQTIFSQNHAPKLMCEHDRTRGVLQHGVRVLQHGVRWTSSYDSTVQKFGDEDLIEEELEDPTVDELLEDAEFNQNMREFHSIPGYGHRVFVIQPVTRAVWKGKSTTTGELQMEESLALVDALPQWQVISKELLLVKRPQSKYIFERAQMEELTLTMKKSIGITAVFFSINLLNKFQLDMLQKCWKVPVFDRYSLVLQIFKEYARTKEAKLQVALAEIPVIRSRLDRIQIIMNAPVLRQREQKIYKALEELKKQRGIIRKNRLKRKLPTVAVVGYTNAGKTTLIKALTNDANLEPENRLFATLDITAHAGRLPNHMAAVYMDTVGFMSNIPVSLFNAFSATLEDASLADVVIHIRDISHPDTIAQRENVLTTIRPMLTTTQMDTIIEVCNKVDKLDSIPDVDGHCHCISAVTGQGLDSLKHLIQTQLLENTDYTERRFRIPLNGDHLRWLYKEATVVSSEVDSSGESLIVNVIIGKEIYAKFSAHFGGARKKLTAR